MKLFSLSEFSTKAVEAFRRFPLTLIWVIVSAAILIIYVEQDFDSIFEEYINMTITAILGVSWLIGTQFYIEQFNKKGLWWIKIIVFLLLIGFYFTLPERDPETFDTETTPYVRWLLFFIAGHIALFFAPFITVWHPKAYWNYLGNMMTAIARSALFSGVLYLGLVLALLAVQFLFDIDIEEYRYFQLFIICLGIVNTWVYLSDFPKGIQHNIHMTFYKAAEVFVKFILIPLAILYMTILYAYAFKIVIQWELPKGWVSYLVTALAGLLFVIQCIIHPVRISHESRIIRKFHPLVYWLLLPLLPLLFAAIYKRVSDYGITEPRYFLILLAFFITGATLYLIFSRKQQLRYLPMALAVFAILGSFGFWGAFQVSTRSQLGEFEEVYTAFAKAEKGTSLTADQTLRFNSITRYLAERKAFEEMGAILGYHPKTKFPEIDNWSLPEKILELMELTPTNIYASRSNRFYANESNNLYIAGYDWQAQFNLENIDDFTSVNNVGDYTVELHKNGRALDIKKEHKMAFKVRLETFLQSLDTLPKQKFGELTQDQLSLMGENDSLKIKVYFNYIVLKDSLSPAAATNVSGSILLKTKK